MEDYSAETITDTDILDLAKKVSVKDNDELTKLCPEKRASVVTIKMNDGTEIEQRVYYPKGEPENPLTQLDLEEKFRSLAMFGGLTSAECDEVVNEIWKEDIDLNMIMRIVCK